MKSASDPTTIVQEIEIEAPAARVFEALVSPEQRVVWWGGGRAGSPEMESDLRPGGTWRMRFEGWGGKPASVRGEYRTSDPPRLLIFTWRPDWYDSPTETLVRFDLTEKAGITTVRITHSGLATEDDRKNHQGWPHLLAALHDYVARISG